MKKFLKRALVVVPFFLCVVVAIIFWVFLGEENIDIPLIDKLIDWTKK